VVRFEICDSQRYAPVGIFLLQFYVIYLFICLFIYLFIYLSVLLKLGHAVAQLIEELRSKPEGRGLHSRWCHWNFSLP
jgi:hypothetical protein